LRKQKGNQFLIEMQKEEKVTGVFKKKVCSGMKVYYPSNFSKTKSGSPFLPARKTVLCFLSTTNPTGSLRFYR